MPRVGKENQSQWYEMHLDKKQGAIASNDVHENIQLIYLLLLYLEEEGFLRPMPERKAIRIEAPT